MSRLTLLYRGPLESCNYGCSYCPFAHRASGDEELRADERALARLVRWVEAQRGRLGLFFTPRGEALVHRHYQQAIAALSRLPQVDKVAVQTNLSGALDWLEGCDASRVGIWATYHPAFARRRRFLASCRELEARGVRFSVGMVALPEHLAELEALRGELPDHVYVWANAEKRHPACDDPAFVARVEAIDPLFRWNLRPHASRGLRCRAGETVLAVDGDGNARRCWFVEERLGNLYADELSALLAPRPCPNRSCRCHIGYVHLVPLGLAEVFGDGVLERAPAQPLSLRDRPEPPIR